MASLRCSPHGLTPYNSGVSPDYSPTSPNLVPVRVTHQVNPVTHRRQAPGALHKLETMVNDRATR
ncbi:hypothetical protein JHK82_022294 [Glycine max]|nr:hypothetical protein JHK85_022781 [Glycine max]KAG5026402.1 hypothetical protein JHK86_022316 [Glycine max]KAG5137563.1 hypothetical protein JHK82_022294 [Glycine max]KHM98797.1 hypothetical protein glysoja_022207 [Glycine soja]